MPAAIAANGPPPAASTVKAANCAAPENTITDITIAAIRTHDRLREYPE
jgi:hypothetical protein